MFEQESVGNLEGSLPPSSFASSRVSGLVLDGFSVFIQKAHALYLIGMEIDWQDGLNNRGFTFNNPNAKETCGCGTSFSA